MVDGEYLPTFDCGLRNKSVSVRLGFSYVKVFDYDLYFLKYQYLLWSFLTTFLKFGSLKSVYDTLSDLDYFCSVSKVN